eukprot:730737-Rhodomonas_salina.2
MLERTQYRRRNAGRSALLLCVAIASAGLPLCRAECEDDTDCGSEKAVINRDGSYVYTAENLVVARGYCRDASRNGPVVETISRRADGGNATDVSAQHHTRARIVRS